MTFFNIVLSDTPYCDEDNETFSNTLYQYFVVAGIDENGHHILRGVATSRYRFVPVSEIDVIKAVLDKYSLSCGYVHSSMYMDQEQSITDFNFFCEPAPTRDRMRVLSCYWLTYAYHHADGTFRIFEDFSYGTYNNFTNICEMESHLTTYLIEQIANQTLDDTMEAINPSLPVTVTLIKWQRMR